MTTTPTAMNAADRLRMMSSQAAQVSKSANTVVDFILTTFLHFLVYAINWVYFTKLKTFRY